MKKILLILLCAALLSCCQGNNNYPAGVEEVSSAWPGETGKVELIDLSFGGETHQYVHYWGYREGSLSHWEGCKYCKKHKDE